MEDGKRKNVLNELKNAQSSDSGWSKSLARKVRKRDSNLDANMHELTVPQLESLLRVLQKNRQKTVFQN